MATPKLMVLESDALNAFASGVNEKQFTITVTTGLIRRWTTGRSRRSSPTNSPIFATAT